MNAAHVGSTLQSYDAITNSFCELAAYSSVLMCELSLAWEIRLERWM